MKLKKGDLVRVTDGNGTDNTFDKRFAGKSGVIIQRLTGVWKEMFRVRFNPEDFNPDEPIPENMAEYSDTWKERLLSEPLTEGFWREELTVIKNHNNGT